MFPMLHRSPVYSIVNIFFHEVKFCKISDNGMNLLKKYMKVNYFLRYLLSTFLIFMSYCNSVFTMVTVFFYLHVKLNQFCPHNIYEIFQQFFLCTFQAYFLLSVFCYNISYDVVVCICSC